MTRKWFNEELDRCSKKVKNMPDWMRGLRGKDIPTDKYGDPIPERRNNDGKK